MDCRNTTLLSSHINGLFIHEIKNNMIIYKNVYKQHHYTMLYYHDDIKELCKTIFETHKETNHDIPILYINGIIHVIIDNGQSYHSTDVKSAVDWILIS